MGSHHHLLYLFLLSLIPTPLSHPDSGPLLAFRSTANPSLSSWTPSTSPCTWKGVTCRSGRVAHLIVPSLSIQAGLRPLTFLPYLRLLNLSGNRISGGIPVDIVKLIRLRRLDLSSNQLSGPIPVELGLVKKLVTLRLEVNKLTGGIPEFGLNGGLTDFNVSFNRLVGEIPASLSGFPLSAFAGNWNLYGPPRIGKSKGRPKDLTGQPKNLTGQPTNCLTDCTGRSGNVEYRTTKSHDGKFKIIALVVVVVVTVVVVTVGAAVYLIYKKKIRKTVDRETLERVGEGVVMFFEGCKAFAVEELMRGSAEMLGRGVVGTTYRVVMEGEAGGGVVVKRVRRAARGAVAVEAMVRELGRLRHRNVVSLRACYVATDEILLVYDFLAGGSLHALLHGDRGPGRTPLDWPTRLKLALAAANGLAFLHSTTLTKHKLSHQNLTSSNILLDDDGNARIADFGLHHLLTPLTRRESTARQKFDVYCFGVVLLEILTGRIIDECETELSKWVERVLEEEQTLDVFDLELIAEDREEMVALWKVARACVSNASSERPRMVMVSKMIEDISKRRGDDVRSAPRLSSATTDTGGYQSAATTTTLSGGRTTSS